MCKRLVDFETNSDYNFVALGPTQPIKMIRELLLIQAKAIYFRATLIISRNCSACRFGCRCSKSKDSAGFSISLEEALSELIDEDIVSPDFCWENLTEFFDYWYPSEDWYTPLLTVTRREY